VESDSYAFLAEVVENGLLGSADELDPVLLERYWSGELSVPSAIESDVASYLSQHDSEALARASIWIARNHILSGQVPNLHLSLVQWLFRHGYVDRLHLLSLLALLSLGALDKAGLEIALLSREALDEGRIEEGLELIQPLLLAYRPS